MTRKRFRTIQSTNIGSSSSQPPTLPIASSSQQATPPIDAVSQAAPSTPIGISSEQPTVPSSSSEQLTVSSPSNDDETHEDARVRNECNATCMVEVWNFDEARTPQEGRSQKDKQSRSLQTPCTLEDLEALHVMLTRWKKRNRLLLIEQYCTKLCIHRQIREILCNESATSQPSRQSRMEGTINWSPSDAYAQVLGPERHGRIHSVNCDAQNVAHPEQVPSIPRSAHASTNDLGATLDDSGRDFVIVLCKIVSPPQGENLIFRDYIKAFIKDTNAGSGASASDDSADSARATKD
ncbi:hypothetical protein CJ030_MR3G028960 [Morella rubra]|uniref:Uncharacterized protein n=1 Tax=Morella rubra TaxID=262757 RepID=A0A6A1W1X3_9ROSI|nr:hypothetical protein CJ030_MR3G028960 [Morella rubra]